MGRPRGRPRKQVFEGAKTNWANESIPVDDVQETIVAQTATNLKTFRLLFGSESDDENFKGFDKKERKSLAKTCADKKKSILKKINDLEKAAEKRLKLKIAQSKLEIQESNAVTLNGNGLNGHNSDAKPSSSKMKCLLPNDDSALVRLKGPRVKQVNRRNEFAERLPLATFDDLKELEGRDPESNEKTIWSKGDDPEEETLFRQEWTVREEVLTLATPEPHSHGFPVIVCNDGPPTPLCFLCGSAGLQQLIYCSICCEAFHPYCSGDPNLLSLFISWQERMAKTPTISSHSSITSERKMSTPRKSSNENNQMGSDEIPMSSENQELDESSESSDDEDPEEDEGPGFEEMRLLFNDWRCFRCTTCAICGEEQNSSKEVKGKVGVLTCFACKISFHKVCFPRKVRKDGMKLWFCDDCFFCKSCKIPLEPKMCKTVKYGQDNFLLCRGCFKGWKAGHFCPICVTIYDNNDYDTPMMECGTCSKWVHAKCEEMSEEEYLIIGNELPEHIDYTCRLCEKSTREAYWRQAVDSARLTGIQAILALLEKTTFVVPHTRIRLFSPLPNESGEGKVEDGSQIKWIDDESAIAEEDEPHITSLNGEIKSKLSPSELAELYRNAKKDFDFEPKECRVILTDLSKIKIIAADPNSIKKERDDEKGFGVFPRLNDLPALPSIQSFPSMPNLPELPSLPTLPTLPKFPDILPTFKTKGDKMEFSPKLKPLPLLNNIEEMASLPLMEEVKPMCDIKPLEMVSHFNPIDLNAVGRASFDFEGKDIVKLKANETFIERLKFFIDEGTIRDLLDFYEIGMELLDNLYGSAKGICGPDRIKKLEDVKGRFREIISKVFKWFDAEKIRNSELRRTSLKSKEEDLESAELRKIFEGRNPFRDIFWDEMDKVDKRRCKFCNEIGDQDSEKSGRLLWAGCDDWVHVNCALWSSEVYELDDGALQKVGLALVRTKNKQCQYCKNSGASLNCCAPKCKFAYHFPCSFKDNCSHLEDKKVFCPSHKSHARGSTVQDEFRITRKVFVDLEWLRKKQETRPLSSLKIFMGSLKIERLGEIFPISKTRFVTVPLGLSSFRLYWSMENPFETCVYQYQTLLRKKWFPHVEDYVEANNHFLIDHDQMSFDEVEKERFNISAFHDWIDQTPRYFNEYNEEGFPQCPLFTKEKAKFSLPSETPMSSSVPNSPLRSPLKQLSFLGSKKTEEMVEKLSPIPKLPNKVIDKNPRISRKLSFSETERTCTEPSNFEFKENEDFPKVRRSLRDRKKIITIFLDGGDNSSDEYESANDGSKSSDDDMEVTTPTKRMTRSSAPEPPVDKHPGFGSFVPGRRLRSRESKEKEKAKTSEESPCPKCHTKFRNIASVNKHKWRCNGKKKEKKLKRLSNTRLESPNKRRKVEPVPDSTISTKSAKTESKKENKEVKVIEPPTELKEEVVDDEALRTCKKCLNTFKTVDSCVKHSASCFSFCSSGSDEDESQQVKGEEILKEIEIPIKTHQHNLELVEPEIVDLGDDSPPLVVDDNEVEVVEDIDSEATTLVSEDDGDERYKPIDKTLCVNDESDTYSEITLNESAHESLNPPMMVQSVPVERTENYTENVTDKNFLPYISNSVSVYSIDPNGSQVRQEPVNVNQNQMSVGAPDYLPIGSQVEKWFKNVNNSSQAPPQQLQQQQQLDQQQMEIPNVIPREPTFFQGPPIESFGELQVPQIYPSQPSQLRRELEKGIYQTQNFPSNQPIQMPMVPTMGNELGLENEKIYQQQFQPGFQQQQQFPQQLVQSGNSMQTVTVQDANGQYITLQLPTEAIQQLQAQQRPVMAQYPQVDQQQQVQVPDYQMQQIQYQNQPSQQMYQQRMIQQLQPQQNVVQQPEQIHPNLIGNYNQFQPQVSYQQQHPMGQLQSVELQQHYQQQQLLQQQLQLQQQMQQGSSFPAPQMIQQTFPTSGHLDQPMKQIGQPYQIPQQTFQQPNYQLNNQPNESQLGYIMLQNGSVSTIPVDNSSLMVGNGQFECSRPEIHCRAGVSIQGAGLAQPCPCPRCLQKLTPLQGVQIISPQKKLVQSLPLNYANWTPSLEDKRIIGKELLFHRPINTSGLQKILPATMASQVKPIPITTLRTDVFNQNAQIPQMGGKVCASGSGANVAVVRPMEHPLQKISDQISQIENSFNYSVNSPVQTSQLVQPQSIIVQIPNPQSVQPTTPVQNRQPRQMLRQIIPAATIPEPPVEEERSQKSKSIKFTLKRREGVDYEVLQDSLKDYESVPRSGQFVRLKITGKTSGGAVGSLTDVAVLPVMHTVPDAPTGCEGFTVPEGTDIESIAKKAEANKKLTHRAVIIYEVTCNGAVVFRSSDVRAVWNQTFAAVNDSRLKHNLPPLPYPSAGISRTYQEMEELKSTSLLGLTHKAIQFLLSQLKVNKNMLEDSETNPIFSARLDGFKKRKPFDMFGWLSSKHRDGLNCTEKLSPTNGQFEGKQIVEGNTNLPIAMRFRNLNKNLKSSSLRVCFSTIHGRGLYTKCDIEAGEMVIEYAGEVIRTVLCDKREKYFESKGIGCYFFKIDDLEVVDATMKGNAARFINHSCEPNCEAKYLKIHGKKHIVIFSLRKIINGEELTYDYKFNYEDDSSKIPCSCKSKKCRKFLN